MDFIEELTPRNSSILRFAQNLAPVVYGGTGSNLGVDPAVAAASTYRSPSVPTVPFPGSPMLGYTTRTSPEEIAATQRAAAINLTLPSNQGGFKDRTNLEAAQYQLQQEDARSTMLDTMAKIARLRAPISQGMDDNALLSAQLARDPSGGVKELLSALGKGQLKAFRPEGGIGNAPSLDALKSTLDVNLASHAKFQEMLSRDPRRAAYVYEAITGRPYEADVKGYKDITGARDKFKMGLVQELIRDDAQVDPATGKLMHFANIMTKDPTSPTGDSKVVRQLIEASPEKTQAWHEMYGRLTGQADPMLAAAKSGASTQRMAAVADQVPTDVMNHPAVKAAVSEAERVIGKKLTAKEQIMLIQNRLKANPNFLGDAGILEKPGVVATDQFMRNFFDSAADKVIKGFDATANYLNPQDLFPRTYPNSRAFHPTPPEANGARAWIPY